MTLIEGCSTGIGALDPILCMNVMGTSLGSLIVTILKIVAVIVVAKVLVRWIPKTLRKADEKSDMIDLSNSTHKFLSKVITYGVYLIAIAYILKILGIEDALYAGVAAAGVAGIAIGFAAKDILGNMLSGIFIAIDQPFKFGQFIKVKDYVGTVEDISLRTTKLKTPENLIVIIPNSIMATNPITNFSAQPMRKLIIPVGITYDSDPEEAKRILTDGLRLDEMVAQNVETPVEVLIKEFGDFSVNLEVRIWITTEPPGVLGKKTYLVDKIKKLLDNAGIEIAFPTRVNIQKTESKPVKKKKTKK